MRQIHRIHRIHPIGQIYFHGDHSHRFLQATQVMEKLLTVVGFLGVLHLHYHKETQVQIQVRCHLYQILQMEQKNLGETGLMRLLYQKKAENQKNPEKPKNPKQENPGHK